MILSDSVNGMQSVPKITKTALLFIYSPKIIPDQQVRGYQYNFNEHNIPTLFEAAETYSKGGIPGASAQTTINECITLDAMGLPLNTSTLSTYWTFTLIMNNPGPDYSNMSFDGSDIMSGYFVDSEPVNIATIHMGSPTINGNAIMVFTHSVHTYKVGHMTPNQGAVVKLNVNGVGDHIGIDVAQHLPGDIYLSGPQGLSTADSLEDAEAYSLSDLLVSNYTHNSTMVPDAMKSPRHQLNNIMNAITVSKDMDDGFVLSDITSDMHHGPSGIFTENLYSNMTIPQSNNLDVSVPISIQQLDFQLQGQLNIQPILLPKQSEWAIKPQTSISHEIIMSSMITHTINAIAAGIGISNIAFQYHSYAGDFGSTNGAWEIIETVPPAVIMPVSDVQLKGILLRFKQQLELNLFPLLKNNGDFQLLVHYDLIGETLVDFHYMDNPVSCGFVETPNRLSSMVNPNLMDSRGIMNNINSIKEIKNILDTNSGGMLYDQFSPSEYGYSQNNNYR